MKITLSQRGGLKRFPFLLRLGISLKFPTPGGRGLRGGGFGEVLIGHEMAKERKGC
jgi:hypothetical protein